MVTGGGSERDCGAGGTDGAGGIGGSGENSGGCPPLRTPKVLIHPNGRTFSQIRQRSLFAEFINGILSKFKIRVAGSLY
ncbi:hypothetical protein LJR153_005345 [Paenibacillus sp. LjRoot153]|uniref:hypothetical protein n=1 Tax=Paenibacillus sp. LjRoot153 TaxID=3342270 RepID=UPI003ECF1506